MHSALWCQLLGRVRCRAALLQLTVLICLALGELFQPGWSQSSALCVSQPVGKAFAMVANRSSNGHALASERIKSNDGDEEIIKVGSRLLGLCSAVRKLGD